MHDKTNASPESILIVNLKDKDWNVRKRAAESFGEIGDASVVGPLIEALMDEDWDVRREAAKALGKIGDARAVIPLIDALKDKDSWTRERAAKALGKIGDACAVVPLIDTLKDEDWYVRRKAAEALGEIRDSRAVVSLINALDDEDWDVHREAIESLERIGDLRALKPLIAEFKSKHSYFLKSTIKCFKKLKNINYVFMSYYPHLFCTRCYLRGKKRKARLGLFRYFSYVLCRGCESSLHLIKGVREVVGIVGLTAQPLTQVENRVYVNLWSKDEKKAKNADIDILEIRRSDEGIQYEWAINAVINMLKNDVSRPSDYLKKVPVIIKDNLYISPGTTNMLEANFGEVKWKN